MVARLVRVDNTEVPRPHDPHPVSHDSRMEMSRWDGHASGVLVKEGGRTFQVLAEFVAPAWRDARPPAVGRTASPWRVENFGFPSLNQGTIQGWSTGLYGGLQRNQSQCIPKPMRLSRRDDQGAAIWHKARKVKVTLVSLLTRFAPNFAAV